MFWCPEGAMKGGSRQDDPPRTSTLCPYRTGEGVLNQAQVPICDAGIVTMCGDCTSFIALTPLSGCRWRRCWTAAKNWLNSTSAFCVRCHRSLQGEMSRTCVMLAFV